MRNETSREFVRWSRTGVAVLAAMTVSVVFAPAQVRAGNSSQVSTNTARESTVRDDAGAGLGRRWFGEMFRPAPAAPKKVVRGAHVKGVVREWLGICDRAEDEFALHDCEKRAHDYASGTVESPIVQVVTNAAEFTYDFESGGFRATFEDEFLGGGACDDPGLSVYAPTMPAAVRSECSPGGHGGCAPAYAMPRTHRELDFDFPMSEEKARAWKARNRNEWDRPKLLLVVRLLRGQGWRRDFTYASPDGDARATCLRGVLAEVLGLRVTVTDGNATIAEVAEPAWMSTKRKP